MPRDREGLWRAVAPVVGEGAEARTASPERPARGYTRMAFVERPRPSPVSTSRTDERTTLATGAKNRPMPTPAKARRTQRALAITVSPSSSGPSPQSSSLRIFGIRFREHLAGVSVERREVRDRPGCVRRVGPVNGALVLQVVQRRIDEEAPAR